MQDFLHARHKNTSRDIRERHWRVEFDNQLRATLPWGKLAYEGVAQLPRIPIDSGIAIRILAAPEEDDMRTLERIRFAKKGAKTYEKGDAFSEWMDNLMKLKDSTLSGDKDKMNRDEIEEKEKLW